MQLKWGGLALKHAASVRAPTSRRGRVAYGTCIQSPQKILLALARKSLLGKNKHKSRKAGSLGSPALQVGGCSQTRGAELPCSTQHPAAGTGEDTELEEAAAGSRRRAHNGRAVWHREGTWMLGTSGPAGKKEEVQHGSWHGRRWEGSPHSKRKMSSQLCDRNICNHPSTTYSCSVPAIPFKAACHSAAS